MENPFLHQHEGDQQAADPAIAVEEWMHRLKLGMGNTAVNQGGQIMRLMENVRGVRLGNRGANGHK